LDGPNKGKDTPYSHIDRKEVLEKEFPDKTGCFLEDYRKEGLLDNGNITLHQETSPLQVSLNGSFISSPRSWGICIPLFIGMGTLGNKPSQKTYLKTQNYFIFSIF
jgi:hypothetical protein